LIFVSGSENAGIVDRKGKGIAAAPQSAVLLQGRGLQRAARRARQIKIASPQVYL
jgi:hypothetical protein